MLVHNAIQEKTVKRHKILVFWKSGHLEEVVAYERWSHCRELMLRNRGVALISVYFWRVVTLSIV